jgi:hypothetical protein
MIEWYFPWQLTDMLLKLQLIVWLSVVAFSYWVFWRSVVKKGSWLRKKDDSGQ